MKIVITLLLITLGSTISGNNLIRIYLDADRTGAKASGVSIEQGIRTALDEIDYKVHNRDIELIIRDHHGNARRSQAHIKEFIKDDNALVMFCGLHSPPVLANLGLINEKGVLLLNPWAAAGPITRSVDKKGRNWVFRLSIDDTKAGEVITAYAVDIEGFKKPVLLLEDTGWGNSNKTTIKEALEKRGMAPLEIVRFKWGIKEHGAREMLNDIYSYGADVIFFVGNAPEGITFFRAMSERDTEKRLPIRSHWGITGGSIFEKLGADILVEEVDLKFLQTSFSFLNKELSPLQQGVYRDIVRLYPDINSPEDIRAPNGFIHGYDLTKILIEAIRNTSMTGDTLRDRELIRSSLESVKGPVQGFIKIYSYPFSVFSEKNLSAHEALDIDNFLMAKFRDDGAIVILDEDK